MYSIQPSCLYTMYRYITLYRPYDKQTYMLLEQKAHVLHVQASHGARVPADGAIEDQTLLLLQAEDAFLDSVLQDEPRGVDGLVLADAVRAIDGLHAELHTL